VVTIAQCLGGQPDATELSVRVRLSSTQLQIDFAFATASDGDVMCTLCLFGTPSAVGRRGIDPLAAAVRALLGVDRSPFPDAAAGGRVQRRTGQLEDKKGDQE
jgi:hypothetical protein